VIGKNIRENLSGSVINGVPQPSLLLLTFDKAPHLVEFSFFDVLNDFHRSWFQRFEQRLIDGF
jgi:hypothetical protein